MLELKEKKGVEENKGKCALPSEENLFCTGPQMLSASSVEACPRGAGFFFDGVAIE